MDWNVITKIVVGGFGVTILTLIILALVTWIQGMVIGKFERIPPKDKEG